LVKGLRWLNRREEYRFYRIDRPSLETEENDLTRSDSDQRSISYGSRSSRDNRDAQSSTFALWS
jgi:hypothetical protein